MGELRKGPGFRARCVLDDGSMMHNTIDLHGPFDLGIFGRALRLLGRCACGAEMVTIGGDDPEPKDAPAYYEADRAHCAAKATKKRGRRG